MTGLVDLAGEETAPIPGAHPKARQAKLSLRRCRPYRIDSHGARHVGHSLPVFTAEGGRKRLSQWFIFEDGLTRFGLDGVLAPLEEAAEKFASGEVITSIVAGERIEIAGLGELTAAGGSWQIDPAERLREARNELVILRGGPGAIRRCREAFDDYQREPTAGNHEALRVAYQAVPAHLRLFCGDMDSKDWPIRRALGFEDSSTR